MIRSLAGYAVVAALFSFFAFDSISAYASNCVWPDSVTQVTGTLFPRSASASDGKAQARDRILVRLSSPTCIIGYTEDAYNVQIEFDSPPPDIGKMFGKDVIVRGKAELAFSSYHVAPIIIVATDIIELNSGQETGVFPPIPQIDVERICNEFAPTNVVAYNYCINEQQRGYNNLKIVWDHTSREVKEKCLKADDSEKRSNNPYRYAAMADCVNALTQQEYLNGTRQIPKDRFKY